MKYLRLLTLCLFQFSSSLVFSQAGSLDPSLSGNGKLRTSIGNSISEAFAVTVQPADQKILVAGDYIQDAQYGGGYSFCAARYLPDGTLDNSFGVGGKLLIILGNASSSAHSIAIQADGKILLAGSYYINSNPELCLIRLTADGIPDNTFNNGGFVFLSSWTGMRVVLQPDGKIIVSGSYYVPGSPTNKANFGVVRYNSNGIIDNSFGTNGQVITDVGGRDLVTGLALQPDGKIVVTGYRDNNYIVAVRYMSSGNLDYSFGSGGKSYITIGDGQDCGAAGMTLQSDGKILIVGQYTTQTYARNFIIVRLNSNGTLDNSFAGNGKKGVNFNGFDFGYAIAQQANGKIVVVGQTLHDMNSTQYQFALCRLNIDGSLDNNFGDAGKVAVGWTDYMAVGNSVAIQANGRIVAAGISGSDIGVMRFLASGSNQVNAQTPEAEQTITPELSSSIRIYPNPASNQLQVSGLIQDGPTILTVMDISGKTLMSKIVVAQSNYAIDISGLAPGNYLLMITGNKKQQSIPFIKMR
jgi:uncharacterized delta-60 repeat protein